jgi:hypothetical protein
MSYPKKEKHKNINSFWYDLMMVDGRFLPTAFNWTNKIVGIRIIQNM